MAQLRSFAERLIGKPKDTSKHNQFLDHAELLHRNGRLGDRELRDARRVAARDYWNEGADDEIWNEAFESGNFERLDALQRAAAYEAGENQEAADERANAAALRVAGNFVASAWINGVMSTADAHKYLKKHVAINPDDDPDAAMADILNDTVTGEKLERVEQIPAWAREDDPDPEPLYGKHDDRSPDEQLDSFLEKSYGPPQRDDRTQNERAEELISGLEAEIGGGDEQ